MSSYDAIEVVIHPQSVVHSAVRFVDGSLKAQLGTPDMRLPDPVRPDLSRPPPVAVGRGRISSPPAGSTSAPPTRRASPRSGSPARPAGSGRAPAAALIAADDVAVARFLDGTLGFTGIPALLEAAVERFGGTAGADRRPTSMSWSRSTPRSARPSRPPGRGRA